MNLARVTASFARMGASKILQVEKASFIALGTEMAFKSPVKNGQFKASWVGGIMTPNNETFQPGRDAVGAVTLMLAGFATGQTFYYTNSLPYAPRIENGWSNQRPHGVVRLTARRWPQIVAAEIRAVQ